MKKVYIKFANGNGLAFLGQGYVCIDGKKVFVRMYTSSSLNRLYLRMYRHHGYSFVWNDFIKDQCDFNHGTMFTFDVCHIRETVGYSWDAMAMLEQVFQVINFKLL